MKEDRLFYDRYSSDASSKPVDHADEAYGDGNSSPLFRYLPIEVNHGIPRLKVPSIRQLPVTDCAGRLLRRIPMPGVRRVKLSLGRCISGLAAGKNFRGENWSGMGKFAASGHSLRSCMKER